MSAKLANGQKVVVRNKLSTLQVAIGTPWGPAVIFTAFAIIPGIDGVLILRSKTLREKLGIDVMASLRGKAHDGDRSSGEMPEDLLSWDFVATCSRDDERHACCRQSGCCYRPAG